MDQQGVCLPLLYFSVTFSFFIVFASSASHSFFHLLPIPSFFHFIRPCIQVSLDPLSFSFFPHLILRVHSVKTKIHQKSGGIATDRTAVCVCVLWSRQWGGWILLSERFQAIFQLIGKFPFVVLHNAHTA